MSSFDIFESSEEGSNPLEIYTINIGSTTHRFTSAASDITIGPDTWAAESLKRSKIATSTERNERITLTFPGDNAFARRYLGIVPGERAFINIIRLQRDEVPTYQTQALIYKGQISAGSYSRDGTEIQITATSVEAATQRKIPRFNFMGMCNHVLFDSGCKKSTGGFVVTDNVESADGSQVVVPGAAAFADGFFAGGWVKTTDGLDHRLILSHVGNVLTLLLPFSADVVGAEIQAFAGCDHLFNGDCATKFDNVTNFGGFPFVPTKNIYQTGLD